MVIADMTDSFLDTESVRGVFEILVKKSRSLKCSQGKLCMLDEAHKYLEPSKNSGADRGCNRYSKGDATLRCTHCYFNTVST